MLLTGTRDPSSSVLKLTPTGHTLNGGRMKFLRVTRCRQRLDRELFVLCTSKVAQN